MAQESQKTLENNPNADTFKEMAKLRAQQRGEVTEPDEELPQGSPQDETIEETPELKAESTEEASEAPEGDTKDGDHELELSPGEEEPIRIGDQTFKTQKEAIAYAEKLEYDKIISEAHAAGVREALEAQRLKDQPTPEEPEDDNFEERFYANPKEALREIEERAIKRAEERVSQSAQREQLWNEFLNEYPDIRRKDAERVLQENWDTIGTLTDYGKGKKLLAQKVRAEYDEIVSRLKPKVAMERKAQALSPSGGAPRGVTPQAREEKPLSFAEQMRKLKGLR